MDTLRAAIVKLANENPELRLHLLPILRKNADHVPCDPGSRWNESKKHCEIVDHPSGQEGRNQGQSDRSQGQSGRYQFASENNMKNLEQAWGETINRTAKDPDLKLYVAEFKFEVVFASRNPNDMDAAIKYAKQEIDNLNAHGKEALKIKEIKSEKAIPKDWAFSPVYGGKGQYTNEIFKKDEDED